MFFINNIDMEDNLTPIEKNQPFEVTLDTYRNMIYFIINRYCDTEVGDYRVCKEDLFQEACIALYDAIKQFSEEKEAKFSTFAYSVIKRRVEHKLRTYLRPLLKESYSTDMLSDIDYFSKYSSDEHHTQQYFKHKLDSLYKFMTTLSREEIEIIKLRTHAYTYKDISKHLKLSEKRIDNQLQKLRRKYQIFEKKERRLSSKPAL